MAKETRLKYHSGGTTFTVDSGDAFNPIQQEPGEQCFDVVTCEMDF